MQAQTNMRKSMRLRRNRIRAIWKRLKRSKAKPVEIKQDDQGYINYIGIFSKFDIDEEDIDSNIDSSKENNT